MSYYIPFEIQAEIIKSVADVKSLIRFRSVSKPWKSLIDSSEFIVGYRSRKMQTPRILLRKKSTRYHQQDLLPKVSALIEQLNDTVVIDFSTKESTDVVGYSRGLLCLNAINYGGMLVLWNPSIRRSVGILASVSSGGIFGFAVCPVTNEPTIVKISIPWKVEIFTLTSKRWTVIQCTKPREKFYFESGQVVIGNCIYRVAHESGMYHVQYMILSFDLIAKEFRAIDLPDKITKPPTSTLGLRLSKLKGSLFVFALAKHLHSAKVWKMEPDCSFTQLFTINKPDLSMINIEGFTKNGELVVKTIIDRQGLFGKKVRNFALNVYDPCSQQLSNLGVSGQHFVCFLGYYKETLLLLDHPDSCIYPEVN